jgi:hypothetical protein
LAEIFLQSCLHALLPLVAASTLLEGVEEGLLVFLECSDTELLGVACGENLEFQCPGILYIFTKRSLIYD